MRAHQLTDDITETTTEAEVLEAITLDTVDQVLFERIRNQREQAFRMMADKMGWPTANRLDCWLFALAAEAAAVGGRIGLALAHNTEGTPRERILRAIANAGLDSYEPVTMLDLD